MRASGNLCVATDPEASIISYDLKLKPSMWFATEMYPLYRTVLSCALNGLFKSPGADTSYSDTLIMALTPRPSWA